MTPLRLLVYAAIVVAVGAVAWVAAAPGSRATPPAVSEVTAAPPSTLPAGTPHRTTSNTSTSRVSVSSTAAPAVSATPATVEVSTTPASSTSIQHGDEGDYHGTEPESIAVDFVVAAFAECWSCDADARQERLGELASPDVVAQWPPMSLDERAVFTVRTVIVDDVAVESAGVVQVRASVSIETDLAPAATESVTLEVHVTDGVVVDATLVSDEGGVEETAGS